MKILIINELLISGGAEQSCLKTKKILEKNSHEVYYLNFDNKFEKNILEVENQKNIINIKIPNNNINKSILNVYYYLKIRKTIKKINPDKIILNNIFSSPITILKALRGFEVYQIIRDYFPVCPKSTMIKNDLSVCEGYKYEDCLKCQDNIQMKVKIARIKKLEKLRKTILKKVIAPSQKLTDYLSNYGYDAICVNNPIEITNKCENIEKSNNSDTKEFLYLGGVNEIKGIYKFIDAFNEVSKDKNIKLTIIGKGTSKEDEQKINEYVNKNSKIIYLGYKSHNEVIDVIDKFHFIVVPSLWMENYPTTALEGMLYKCLVLGSNRGGIPEIIGEDRGFIFDVTKKDNIRQVIEKSCNLTEEEYCNIISNAYNYVISNNSYERYYENLMKVFNN